MTTKIMKSKSYLNPIYQSKEKMMLFLEEKLNPPNINVQRIFLKGKSIETHTRSTALKRDLIKEECFVYRCQEAGGTM